MIADPFDRIRRLRKELNKIFDTFFGKEFEFEGAGSESVRKESFQFRQPLIESYGGRFRNKG